jgi:spore coat protein SA
MKKLVIVLPGTLPVPTTKGGAVESLVFNLVKQNEISKRFLIVIFSPFEKNAFLLSKNYNYSVFNFIKSSQFEVFIYKIFRKLFNSILPNEIFHFKVPFKIRKLLYDEIIIENRPDLLDFYFKVAKKQLILHAHNDTFNTISYRKNSLNLSTKLVLSVSKYISNKAAIVFNKEKIKVLYNCSSYYYDEVTKIKSAAEIRSRFKINQSEKIILFSGRLIKEKGVLELIQALNLVPYNFKIFIAGSSWFGTNKSTDYIKLLSKASTPIKDKIIFLGYVNNVDLQKYYYSADLVIVPSIWEEPGALVVTEAISLGIPLIISDSGGIVEYIHSSGAIIVPRENNFVISLSSAISNFITDDEKSRKMRLINLTQSYKYKPDLYFENFSIFINTYE